MTAPTSGTPEPGHLDELALDAIRAGEASRDDADHLAACALCQRRLRAWIDLGAALSAPAPAIEVPAAREAAILAATHAIAARAARPRPPRRWSRLALPAALAGAAAAAALALLVARDRAPARPAAPAIAGDVNRDRQIDILDAFALARALERGQPLAADCDLNRDRRIDRDDVDAAARAAVALGERL
jgi:hypothetical protein